MSNQDNFDNDKGVDVLEAKPKLKKPSMYKVLLLNDDFTPMDFVVEVLTQFFSLNLDKATQIMLQVHTEGRATCGIYTIDIAETKVQMVNDYSKKHQHPLLCISERME